MNLAKIGVSLCFFNIFLAAVVQTLLVDFGENLQDMLIDQNQVLHMLHFAYWRPDFIFTRCSAALVVEFNTTNGIAEQQCSPTSAWH